MGSGSSSRLPTAPTRVPCVPAETPTRRPGHRRTPTAGGKVRQARYRGDLEHGTGRVTPPPHHPWQERQLATPFGVIGEEWGSRVRPTIHHHRSMPCVELQPPAWTACGTKSRRCRRKYPDAATVPETRCPSRPRSDGLLDRFCRNGHARRETAAASLHLQGLTPQRDSAAPAA